MRISSIFPVMRCMAAFAFFAAAVLADAPKPEKSCRDCHDAKRVPPPLPSPHASFDCKECHRHPTGERLKKTKNEQDANTPGSVSMDDIRLNEQQMFSVNQLCQSCHETQFKDWSQSRHIFTYGDSFLNAEHNKMEQPINDCLRCHAMFFEGSIDGIVTPLNNQGPWKLTQPGMAARLSIPCLACHRVHPSEPPPPLLPRYAGSRKEAQHTNSPFVGFYDRREKQFFDLDELPHPKVSDTKQQIPVSQDARIRICYQCHAPSASHRIGTSDDKTPVGVHAGLSCFDCHSPHSMRTADSCAKCHSKTVKCTLDVTQVDLNAKKRKLDIHTITCSDCHDEDSKR